MIDLLEAALAVGGEARGQASFEEVGSDSRAIRPGQLFVALRGERFDGHAFLAEVAQSGAAAALVDRAFADAEGAVAPLPLVVADDTRLALGRLAAHWRSKFTLPLVGITGSNGKTTVKEMCASILRAQAAMDGFDPDHAVLATAGNLNNDIGLPLTLLGLRAHHRAAVIEMGMNHPGEIAYLTAIAAPTVALVNNAQRAHLEGMGGVNEVAREKGAIYNGLGADGVAVINADDPFAAYWTGLNEHRRVLRFALDATAEVTGSYILKGLGAAVAVQNSGRRIDIELHAPGLHNVRNALAATAACLAAGVSDQAVSAGLGAFTGAKGRLQQKLGLNGAVVLDDSYNANPDSVRAGIDVLAATPGRKLLVLGDMGEIGETSGQLHDEVGGYAKSQGVDHLFALGEVSEVAARNFGEGGHHYTRLDDLVSAVRKQMDADTVVLVKGSRFMRMERVIEAIVEKTN
ncbi:UDP-N-acetylmuramoyl-tripeptide--D-alanyl-D-alanine ligase [Cognatazoarcus halotolerans]|uniref:UDP-N-acetylmuramoyl-tripeptide--D-alanyl-D- alanine ligase n=1 Tax=Cognatazoarcus halotolerans TaxID=2686016 RepID=UPI00135B82A0|nr:UDP-N-acetylmuramoyl-tripeptide--D-alanyl-D-alanine ligase [Cognatazoarcus halotolerans]MCB1898750.1 UDP-N-acetylmuramoyl-tripeptide--D-alanyl-D-alanine ligase [Rhodocyclaceae bacterium]MCP5311126.1 UDP-N-acetylmuramoyl-tripeptide--D-alanyl-D-alanine ligase [Zoogloeaceae bacterium]